MREVPIAEFIGKSDEIAEYVLTAPLAITENGRVHLVMISAAEYKRLVQLDSESGMHLA